MRWPNGADGRGLQPAGEGDARHFPRQGCQERPQRTVADADQGCLVAGRSQAANRIGEDRNALFLDEASDEQMGIGRGAGSAAAAVPRPPIGSTTSFAAGTPRAAAMSATAAETQTKLATSRRRAGQRLESTVP